MLLTEEKFKFYARKLDAEEGNGHRNEQGNK